jgi:hypothetical protein
LAGPEVGQLFIQLLSDPSFQAISHLTRREIERMTVELLSNVSFRLSPVIQPGYAGPDPKTGKPILGISPRLPHFLLTAVAAHELFHFVRHMRGQASFSENYPFWRVWGEEIRVWWLTSRFAPTGAGLTLGAYGLAISIPSVLLYLALQFLSNQLLDRVIKVN